MGQCAVAAGRVAIAAARVVGVLWGSGITACILEEDLCGPHQVKVPGATVCRCAPDAVLAPDGAGCVPCGLNEEPRNNTCECRAGFARTSSDLPCEPSTGSTLRQPCSVGEPCSDPNPYCATVAGESYCTTTGCTRNADCPSAWVCRGDAEPRFCAWPVNYGKRCERQEDCAGGEATYCETFQIKFCLIQGCARDPSTCPGDHVCCDLTNLIGRSVCVSQSALTEGKCVGGSAPVGP